MKELLLPTVALAVMFALPLSGSGNPRGPLACGLTVEDTRRLLENAPCLQFDAQQESIYFNSPTGARYLVDYVTYPGGVKLHRIDPRQRPGRFSTH